MSLASASAAAAAPTSWSPASAGRSARGARARASSRQAEVFRGEFFPFAQDHGPIERVLQLADVAGPRPGLEGLDRAFRQPLGRLFSSRRTPESGRTRPGRDVFPPIAQGDRHRKRRKAVVEVLAECFRVDELLQVPVCGRDDPDVHLDWDVSSDPLERLVLQDAEKLCLQGGIQVPHFVQKDRPPVGQLELPDPSLDGTRERSPLVAEELGLEKLARNQRRS